MRRYDDPVEVRRGWIPGPTEAGHGQHGTEGPEQFLWRGQLWVVRAVLAHWLETGSWWRGAGVRAVLGTDEPDLATAPSGPSGPTLVAPDLLAERELWRVEAGRGALDAGATGVFELSFTWSDGCWQLVGCHD